MDLDPILFECSSCSAELVRQEFSKSQLKRHPHSPRCRECVAAEEETAAACAGREPSSDDDGGGSHDDHHHLSAHSDHWSTEEEDEESRDDEDDSSSGVSDPMLKEAPEGLPSPRGGHAKCALRPPRSLLDSTSSRSLRALRATATAMHRCLLQKWWRTMWSSNAALAAPPSWAARWPCWRRRAPARAGGFPKWC